MLNPKQFAIALIPIVVLFLAGCGSGESSDPAAGPGAEPPAQLPPDHPPLQPAQATSGVVPPPAGSGFGTTGLAWSAPDSWIGEQPSSSMRRAQYRIPGAAGDAELVVFYFGPGQGGDAESNVSRWVGEFAQPDGRASSEVATVEKLKIAGLPAMKVSVTGTYSGGGTTMGGGKPRPGQMLFGAIVQGPDANWFFKLTGPEGTVAPQREAFATMLESIQVGD